MTPTIIVGIDGSPSSSRALQWAAGVSRRVAARLQPVMIWDYPALTALPFPVGLPVPPVDAMQADHEAMAELFVDGTSGLDDVTVAVPIVVRGAAGQALCSSAVGADLLVLGSHGSGAIRSLLLGSVSGYCANHAPCPVALTPLHWEPGDTASPMRQVIVGVDGSPHADEAVRWADGWAPTEAHISLLHAWDVPVTVDGAAWELRRSDLEDIARGVGEHALELVSAARRDAGLVEVVIECDDARSMLVDRSGGADLLVLGARSHHGIGRVLLGSVASHTLHHLKIPTVVVGGTPRAD